MEHGTVRTRAAAHRGFRTLVVGTLLLVLALALATTVAAAAPIAGAADTAGEAPAAQSPAAPHDDAEERSELAAQYLPVVVIPAQTTLCEGGESFRPGPVDAILGRDDVVLRGADDQPITSAPDALDLAAAGPEDYLDIPGNPLDPGCDYQTWWATASQGTQPTLYARIATDPGYPGELAVQYWFWWVFNDWNNKHEGDWEMVQLRFPTASAAEALSVAPTEVAYAQHEGSEIAAWDDPKLIREGDRVVVYPSVGSHAGYFDQATWFGKSAAAGFGCDDTSVAPETPGLRIDPELVELPTDVAQASQDPDLAWVAFPGRWGQRAPSFNNGPTGPALKERWDGPITWQQEQGRPNAVMIPPVPGPSAGAFCSLTAAGSWLFIRVLDSPAFTIVTLLLIVVAVVALVRSTTWRTTQPMVLDRRRSAGQIVHAAAVHVARRWAVFLPLGVLFLLGALVSIALRNSLLSSGPSGDVTDTQGALAVAPHILAWLFSVVVVLPLVLLVIVAAMMLAARPGERPSISWAIRQALQQPHIAVVAAGIYLVAVILVGSIVLFPLGLWVLARWAAAPPAAAVEGLGVTDSFRRSAALTHRHRWRALGIVAVLSLLVTGPALVGGALLLLITGLSFAAVNAVVLAWVAATLPVACVGLVMQFYDLRERSSHPSAVAAPQPAA